MTTANYGFIEGNQITCAHGNVLRRSNGDIAPAYACRCRIASGDIPISEWGKDHFSTLGYLECRIVDNHGEVDRRHLRCNRSANWHRRSVIPDLSFDDEKREYPTILRDGTHLYAHDDWSCIDDFEAARLIEWHGTGLHPIFKLTEQGHRICAALRKHKAQAGTFATFRAPEVQP